MRIFRLLLILILSILLLQMFLKEPNNESRIEIPFNFSGQLNYEGYKSLENRILKFQSVTNIGKDQSGNYSMYCIELGNRAKPTILIVASMHGSEYQGTLYSMKFMEALRDGTFPDDKLREKLLNEYHIAYIPAVNPWGYDRAYPYQLNSGRFNSAGKDLNRDFKKFTQAETKNMKELIDQLKPFAFLDIHMMQSDYDANAGNNLVLGNGQPQTNETFDIFIESLTDYADQPVTKWSSPSKVNPTNPGLARTYVRNQSNPYTPYTLSYIYELTKPVKRKVGLDAPLSESQIMDYGMAGMYLFLKTSIKYYEDQN